MCGIVGTAGTIAAKEKRAFEDLLIFSQVRGPHSTGVASVARGSNNTILAKTVGRPDNLIDYDKRYDRVVDFGKVFILGHNRFATVGAVNKKNAHPFNFENIVGCHNGTIQEFRLKNLPSYDTSFGTDSEALLANLDKHSVPEVFKNLDGAWAVVWYDRRSSTLNMIRNKDRQLYYAYSKDRHTIFWASEAAFLKAALVRNEIEKEDTFLLPEDRMYTWKIPDMHQPFEAPTAFKIEYGGWADRVDSFFQNNNSENYYKGYYSGVRDRASWNSYSNKAEEKRSNVVVLSGNSFTVKNVENLKDFASPTDVSKTGSRNDGQGYRKTNKGKDLYRGFRGEELTKTLFEERTKEGCSWCSTPAKWGRPIRFIDRDAFLCLECNEEEDVRGYVGAA